MHQPHSTPLPLTTHCCCMSRLPPSEPVCTRCGKTTHHDNASTAVPGVCEVWCVHSRRRCRCCYYGLPNTCKEPKRHHPRMHQASQPHVTMGHTRTHAHRVRRERAMAGKTRLCMCVIVRRGEDSSRRQLPHVLTTLKTHPYNTQGRSSTGQLLPCSPQGVCAGKAPVTARQARQPCGPTS
jgi:hypothetical protein